VPLAPVRTLSHSFGSSTLRVILWVQIDSRRIGHAYQHMIAEDSSLLKCIASAVGPPGEQLRKTWPEGRGLKFLECPPDSARICNGVRCDKSSNVWTSRDSDPNGSSPHPKNEGRYGLAGGLNFFRSIVTFPRGWRPEIALRRPLEFPTVPSEGISMSGENSYLSRLASNQ